MGNRSRPGWRALAVVSIAVLLIVAASAGPGRIWTVPETNPSEPAAPVVESEPRATSSDGGLDTPGWLDALGPVLLAVAVVSLAAVGAGGIMALGGLRRWRPGLGGRRPGRDHRSTEAVLSPDRREIEIDAEAAFDALRSGPPRNSIVACWVQLEHDAAAAGMARRSSETSSEYVERVVAAVSLDERPIAALAERYRSARFSTRPVTQDDRDEAIDLLGDVLAGLAAARPEVDVR